MTDLKIGQIIDGLQERDAIHVAVVPVVAGEDLEPGCRIGMSEDGRAFVNTTAPIGVVDPFIRGYVSEGERFWLFLYPGTITSLRHNWSHPSFPEPITFKPKLDGPEKSKQWIQGLALSVDLTYAELMEGARNYLETGECIYLGSSSDSIPDEFWRHYAAITGTAASDSGNFFRCAC